MLCGWGGNCRPGGKQWQPTAGWMTYGHLRADCLYIGISSGHNGRYRVWEAFTLYLLLVSRRLSVGRRRSGSQRWNAERRPRRVYRYRP